MEATATAGGAAVSRRLHGTAGTPNPGPSPHSPVLPMIHHRHHQSRRRIGQQEQEQADDLAAQQGHEQEQEQVGDEAAQQEQELVQQRQEQEQQEQHQQDDLHEERSGEGFGAEPGPRHPSAAAERRAERLRRGLGAGPGRPRLA